MFEHHQVDVHISIHICLVFLLTQPWCSITQLESVQQEGLSVNFKSITAETCAIGGWMDYPENASIIDPQEQQSDYYDQ